MHTCTVRKTVKVDYGVLSTQNRIFEMVPNRRHAKPLKWSLELSLSTARRTFEMVLNKFYAEPLEGILNLCFMEISKIEFYTLGKIYTEPMKGSLSKIVKRTCVRYANIALQNPPRRTFKIGFNKCYAEIDLDFF